MSRILKRPMFRRGGSTNTGIMSGIVDRKNYQEDGFVTTIGQTVGQTAPFKAYIPGFADGSGNASVYVTDEDAALSNRLVEDVLQRQQVGAAFRLYTDKQSTEALSRSISMDAALLSASWNINPDDAQMVEIAFRPTGSPTFDLSSSS